MHFEKGAYDRCIEDCDAAVERGRELRADYKTIARALTRKGNSLVKQGKLEDAIDTFQKALTEHRCRYQPPSAVLSMLAPALTFSAQARRRPSHRSQVLTGLGGSCSTLTVQKNVSTAASVKTHPLGRIQR